MYRVYASPACDLTAFEARLSSEGVGVVKITSPALALVEGEPSLLLVDAAFYPLLRTAADFVNAGGALLGWGGEGEADAFDAGELTLDGWVAHPHPERVSLLTMRSCLALSARRLARQALPFCDTEAASQLKELVKVGTALATERDYDAFFAAALSHARRIARADGGSLYLVEGDGKGGKRLHFKLSQNHSRPDIPFSEFTMPLGHASIAGHVALMGETLVLDDVYRLSPQAGYVFNSDFDRDHGYRTKSMVAIPMITHTGEIVGVLQLVNRKRDFEKVLAPATDAETELLAFDPPTVELLAALGGQVAVCLENNRLYDEIEGLFEGFVKASVTAIEQRDPSTKGHSARVAQYTVALAEAADRSTLPAYSSMLFTPDQLRELRYAGLLHDFGKVGVREEVLVKPTKLQPAELLAVRRRHGFLRRTAERDHFRDLARYLEERGPNGYPAYRAAQEQALNEEFSRLDAFLLLVVEANRPTVLPEGDFEALAAYSRSFFEDADGGMSPYLSGEEVRFLSIRKGSLDERERLEVESHVTKTYQFLSQIPWTRSLREVPEIAYGHHEKLNGLGYPLKVGAASIPVQTRMMTITDIFDALTASDRPYKKAVPVEKALDILSDEAGQGLLDRELLDLFIGAGIYGMAVEP